MIPARLLPRSLTWIQPGTVTDAYGNPGEASFTTGTTSTTITGRIDQSTTAETNDETRDLAISARVLLTNELGITSGDRIVDGTTAYEVTGAPFIVDTPRGPHHAEVRLTLLGG